jgi:hypothetical protein
VDPLHIACHSNTHGAARVVLESEDADAELLSEGFHVLALHATLLSARSIA